MKNNIKIFYTKFFNWFNAVHKIHPQSGGETFVQCGHFVNKGERFFGYWRPHIFCKIFGIFKTYGVSARTKERDETADTFCR